MYVCVRLYWYAFLSVFLYVHILIIHAIQHSISLKNIVSNVTEKFSVRLY